MPSADQNPLSQLAVISTSNSLATRVSDLSGNPLDHIDALIQLVKAKSTTVAAVTGSSGTTSSGGLVGEASLQNSLDLARNYLW